MCLFYQCGCSSSFWFLFLSSFLVSPQGTKASSAAGHTGGMEAVLLFRPWCLLCKIVGRRLLLIRCMCVCVCEERVGALGGGDEGGSTKAYLVRFKMVLKQNACKT